MRERERERERMFGNTPGMSDGYSRDERDASTIPFKWSNRVNVLRTCRRRR
jgi:hypothetical protein